MGTRVGREVHGEELKKGDKVGREGSWRATKIFRVLRAARDAFFFAPRLVRLRDGRRYAPTRVTVLTAFTIHLFTVAKFFVAFLRVSQRAFWPKHFLCYLALFSAIQKMFSCCFTRLYIFILARRQRARRDTQ